MTGLEYIRTVCYTTKVGKDPLREDVSDAFEDGVAEGWKQHKESQWKPSDEQMNTLEHYMHTLVCNEHKEILFGLYADLKKLREE